ncbi:helix-turn-helix transcriptional regulator [Pannonibacter sp. Pt2]|uniref:Helix-turn-helix transcriptional regulator n=1 Tax=Pannonibacter anstelovis TaxID=3121537 RepID=A0ABU7ZSC8_9HYPH
MPIDVADTPNAAPSPTAFVIDPERPVLARSERLAPGWAVAPHSHPRSQLLWGMRGVLRVFSADGVWIVPPSHAVWVPGGVPHHTLSETEVEIRNLYVDPSALEGRPALSGSACSVRLMTGLMREIILRLCSMGGPEGPEGHEGKDSAHQRLCALALDEITALAEAPLHLPGGHDPRLLRVTRHLVANPGDGRSLAELGTMAGASIRTLERLFHGETGLTFRQWRSRLRLLSALELLNRGHSSTEIAHRLGYGSASAFSAAFRSYFGTPPQSFLARGMPAADQPDGE